MFGVGDWSCPCCVGSKRQWGSLTNHALGFGYLSCHGFRFQVCGTGQEGSQKLPLAQHDGGLWSCDFQGPSPGEGQAGLQPRAPGQARLRLPLRGCTGSVLFSPGLARGEVPPGFLAVTRVPLPPTQRPTESSALPAGVGAQGSRRQDRPGCFSSAPRPIPGPEGWAPPWPPQFQRCSRLHGPLCP